MELFLLLSETLDFIKPDNLEDSEVFDVENILQEPYSPSKGG